MMHNIISNREHFVEPAGFGPAFFGLQAGKGLSPHAEALGPGLCLRHVVHLINDLGASCKVSTLGSGMRSPSPSTALAYH